MENRLAELTIPDYASFEDRYEIINNTIVEFIARLPQHEPIQIAGDRRKAIDRCFEPSKIEDIFSLLEKESNSSGPQAEWAQKTIQAIRGRSPTSLKVTLRQMELGSKWTIAQAFEREHQIAARFMKHPDFVEGVSARLLRKPPETPQWQPAELSKVSNTDVDSFFGKSDDGPPLLELLKPMNANTNYSNYPHAWTTLPKERDIASYIRKTSQSRESLTSGDVVQYFINKYNGKLGVREIVEDILSRQTVQGDQQLQWRPDWEATLKHNADL